MKTVGECVSRRDAAGCRCRAARRRRRSPSIVRRDRLQRVVRLREQRHVRGRGRVAAVGVELRQPEAVEVRLVADDEVAAGRVRRGRARRRSAAKLAWSSSRQRRRRAAEVVDRRRSTSMPSSFAAAGRRCGAVALLGRRGGASRRAPRVDVIAHGVEAGEREQVELRLRRDERRRLTASSAAPTSIAGPPACAPEREHEAPRPRPRRADPHGAKIALATLDGVTNRVEAAARGAAGEAGRLPLPRRRTARVLYVGKAKSLRSRVRSYFQQTARRPRRRSGSCRRASPTSR